MRLVRMRLRNFGPFGPDSTEINLDPITFLIGPNGAGKTAVLQALSRMFSLDAAHRKVSHSDFHVQGHEDRSETPDTRELWLETDFEFPELAQEATNATDFVAIPNNFAHMQLVAKDGPAQVRFRLKATMDRDGEVDESLCYVISADENGTPLEESRVAKQERSAIQVHYLPARRDPTDHISYSATAMLGRVLRSMIWGDERDEVATLTNRISELLGGNTAIQTIASTLAVQWDKVHKGEYYANPSVSFGQNEIESLLRRLSVCFTPGHGESIVDFSRLSDGQQSLLYLSVVLAAQEIGRKVLRGELSTAFNVDKLRPAIFTLIAVEEPENSLSPHYLGRVIRSLTAYSSDNNTQVLVTTHSASLLRRVLPEAIRYLRLDDKRRTTVREIELPSNDISASKFVREGVQAFPELYFSRLVILCEGASEEIVLPRLLAARAILGDETSISVVPLGGRHVNHFWRLLSCLKIPYVTLLDLDLARHGGGWGRIKYAAGELLNYADTSDARLTEATISAIPAWDSERGNLLDGKGWISTLEENGIFFSTPLDLDFMMMHAFPSAYRIEEKDLEEPNESTIAAVLGKAHGVASQYSDAERLYFGAYHAKFKVGSKPAWHLRAMSEIGDDELRADTPKVLKRLFDQIELKLGDLHE